MLLDAPTREAFVQENVQDLWRQLLQQFDFNGDQDISYQEFEVGFVKVIFELPRGLHPR